LLSEKIGRIQSPKIIRIGGGVAKEIADVLKQLSLSKPLIVTDKNLVELGHVDLVL
jgi:alcohol dehydrogenase class IV